MTDELTAREPVLDAAMREYDARTNGLPAADGHAADRSREADVTAADRRRPAESTPLRMVPETLAVREQIKAACERFAAGVDAIPSVNKGQLERQSRELLAETGLPEKFVGFAMVLLGNALWKRSLLAAPLDRRLLLLPRHVPHAEGCSADEQGSGGVAPACAACSIEDLQRRAERLGYQVRIVEESPIGLKSIVAAGAEGILGIARLDVLEKAIDTVLLAGVPSYAVPLLVTDERRATLDASWVREVLETYEPMPRAVATSYVPLLRAAGHLFNGRFESLLPRRRSTTPQTAKSPLGKTEDVAYDWLANGGKRFRPFITLAAYDAATGGTLLSGIREKSAQVDERDDVEPISDSVARVAMAIEAFHKASLVHDDIQDDDLFRYGRQTLHRTEGIGPAINIGDYLIGLGYRLVNACRGDLGAEVACDILDSMAAAHIKLCDGQGAEMAWQHDPDWEITPFDALQIYSLKTSPAFEAALFAGLRMGGDVADLSDVDFAVFAPSGCRISGAQRPEGLAGGRRQQTRRRPGRPRPAADRTAGLRPRRCDARRAARDPRDL